MFARFRDENATVMSGFAVPGVLLAPEIGQDGAHSVCQLSLKDGRLLGWSDYGARHGFPVLYMHRGGACRLEAGFFDTVAKAAGFRLIAVDRPGLGASGYRLMTSVDGFASDCEQLVHQLGLRRFGVLSWGSGSVFALSVAKRMSQRCVLAAVLSPVERPCQLTGHPLLRTLFTLGLRSLVGIRRTVSKRDAEFYVQRWQEQLSSAERKYSEHSEVVTLLRAVSAEAVRQGTAGVAQDIWLGAGGCRLTDHGLRVPVHSWSAHPVSDGRNVVRHPIHGASQLLTSYVITQVFDVMSAELRRLKVNPDGVSPPHH